MGDPRLALLAERGYLSPLDTHFARTVARLAGETDPDVIFAAALASRQVLHAHVCLDLRRLTTSGPPIDDAGEPIHEVTWPELATWLTALRASPLVSEPGSSDPRLTPLILDRADRLYLRRYWMHQCRLTQAIRTRAGDEVRAIDQATLVAGLRRLFPSENGEIDRQKLAACVAVQRRLCVISGGPGTGKTHTVVKILALLVEQARATGQAIPRLTLLAPTGKAAARLQESVEQAKSQLACAPDVRAAISAQASTIHRALGSVRGTATRFRHNSERPLVTDLVLVDEASMVDLALMARLTDAMPAHARLILLGDEDQLASVEAGAVLGDICNSGGRRAYSRAFVAHVAATTGENLPISADAPAATGIWDCIVQLGRSYRYGRDSGIARLAQAINAGDSERVLAILNSGESDVALRPPGSRDEISRELVAEVRDGFAPAVTAADPAVRLRGLSAFRVLCAHRRGGFGVESVNRQIEQCLIDAGWLAGGETFYIGRPVMVVRNDYRLELFNGDVGVIVDDPDASDSQARGRLTYFDGPDGRARYLSPSRLPPHETVFAMTVHKSQGSEFDAVAIVLPDRASPVLSRELLYTAVTRARRRVTIYAPPEVLVRAVAQRVERASGLRDALWGA